MFILLLSFRAGKKNDFVVSIIKLGFLFCCSLISLIKMDNYDMYGMHIFAITIQIEWINIWNNNNNIGWQPLNKPAISSHATKIYERIDDQFEAVEKRLIQTSFDEVHFYTFASAMCALSHVRCCDAVHVCVRRVIRAILSFSLSLALRFR